MVACSQELTGWSTDTCHSRTRPGRRRNLGGLSANNSVRGGSGKEKEEQTAGAQAQLEIMLEGPATEEHVALARGGSVPAHCGVTLGPGTCAEPINIPPTWELTSFSRRCAELWVEKHGRRFCVYAKRCEQTTRAQTHSDTAVLRRQTKSLDALYRIGEAAAGSGVPPVSAPRRQRTLFGSLRCLQRKAKEAALSLDKTRLRKFRKLTATKRDAVREECKRRRGGEKAYVVNAPRLGTLFEAVCTQAPTATAVSALRVLNLSGDALRDRAGYRVTERSFSSRQETWASGVSADMLVVKAADPLMPGGAGLCRSLLCNHSGQSNPEQQGLQHGDRLGVHVLYARYTPTTACCGDDTVRDGRPNMGTAAGEGGSPVRGQVDRGARHAGSPTPGTAAGQGEG